MIISVLSAAAGMVALLICATFDVNVLTLGLIYVASATPAIVMVLNALVFGGAGRHQHDF